MPNDTTPKATGNDAKPEDESIEHLQQHRPQILVRSLLVGLSGIVPIPVLDDTLATGLRRGLFRSIAHKRNVDIDEGALDILADNGAARPAVNLSVTAAVGTVIRRLRPGRFTRRLFVGLVVLRQVNEAQRAFQQGTLFDHYCAQHHLGPAINVAMAHKLRTAMMDAARSTQREMLDTVFDRALSLASQTAQVGTQRLLSVVRRREEISDKDGPQNNDGQPLNPTLLGAVKGETRGLINDLAITRYSARLVTIFNRRWLTESESPTERPR